MIGPILEIRERYVGHFARGVGSARGREGEGGGQRVDGESATGSMTTGNGVFLFHARAGWSISTIR